MARKLGKPCGDSPSWSSGCLHSPPLPCGWWSSDLGLGLSAGSPQQLPATSPRATASEQGSSQEQQVSPLAPGRKARNHSSHTSQCPRSQVPAWIQLDSLNYPAEEPAKRSLLHKTTFCITKREGHIQRRLDSCEGSLGTAGHYLCPPLSLRVGGSSIQVPWPTCKIAECASGHTT